MSDNTQTPFTVVIPARYQSQRLPGKPLLDIAGKAMVLHVVERALESAAQQVLVATDDERIARVCESAGARVCMTDSEHQSGTDRIAQVASELGLSSDHIVVNVQGDEPLIPAAVINQVALQLAAIPDAGIYTLYAPIHSEEEFHNPNAVKLVTDAAGRVLYFSRAPIPYPRDGISPQSLGIARRHIGLYAYRVAVLQQFTGWQHSALELTEKLEQLRAMEHGIAIYADACCEPIPAGVDTQQDLDEVRKLLASRAEQI